MRLSSRRGHEGRREGERAHTSQRRAVASEEAVTRNAASTEKTQSHTQRRCPFSVRSSENPSRFHSFTVESLDVVTRYLP